MSISVPDQLLLVVEGYAGNPETCIWEESESVVTDQMTLSPMEVPRELISL